MDMRKENLYSPTFNPSGFSDRFICKSRNCRCGLFVFGKHINRQSGMHIMGFKILVGKTLQTAKLDSTWESLSKANSRKKTLRSGLKKSRWGGKSGNVFVVSTEENDPQSYRKPKKNHY